MEFAIGLGKANPAFFTPITEEADRLGFESVWLPEHLILTAAMSRSPRIGESHPPIPPTVPVFDALVMFGFLAGRTERIKFATHVYNIGLRHPFVTARAVQTLDVVSGGRFLFGIGASWLEEEWVATQLDFVTRGRRVDEAIDVCRSLWRDDETTFHGDHFDFEGARFFPKPVQPGGPPILVGGESGPALRRAAARGDGWVGMTHDFESGARQIRRLRELLEEAGRDPDDFQYCLGGTCDSPEDAQRWADLGVSRLIHSPWERSKGAIDGMRAFAEMVGLA